MKPLTHEEKLVFGADAKRHPVTKIPLEGGIGAASESAQARNHLRTIEQTQGADVAAAMLAALELYEQTGELPAAPAAITHPKRRR